MPGVENLIVGAIVVAASVYTAWKLRKVIGGQGTCSCGPKGCPAMSDAKKPNLLSIGGSNDDTIAVVGGGCSGCACKK